MSLRFIVTLLPLVAGWVLAVLFQLKAIAHLRQAKGWARWFAFVGGPFAGSLYTLEGFRYRGLALLSFVIGLILTAIIALLLQSHA
jgi:hypothetical protein